ncbi:M48 family metallopeptidase [Paracoccus liaowanqingii]|uniref:M48 family metallopeptidase n=2 Tax=Paracoccus liaowanqingii TaxID=2560053 RepID=A0A4P7HLZ7_9RHOB|nr:SprT family zinc-dependent metalloprotease [Paracoccus liaowanqingii]QBX35268.1 M48 family metallopeptidase [Paracoccus liaowanqingii]
MASGDQRIILEDGLELRLRRSARARRMTLRVPRDGSGAVLTLPPGVPLAQGRDFALSRQDWLRRAMGRLPGLRLARPGAVLPVEGRALVLTPAAVRRPEPQGDALLIPEGRPAGPVVAAWLKQLALIRLRAACDGFSARLGRPYRAIVLRDTRSRWGSCTQDGRLMFSWRLAMAPPLVLDYVAAHEVAHLAHMDHSARFWAQTEALMPGHAPHRAWLKAEGGDLMLWRFRD